MPLVGVIALTVAACGSPDVPTVGDDTPSEAPSDDPPDVDDADVEVAAACEDLEDRPYEPPAEAQPTPDPELTNAEAVPDLEPLDEADAGTDGDDAAPEAPRTVVDQVREWAMREAPEHFGGVWLDPQHDQATVVGFTEDVDVYAAQVRERFGEGWWVVHADNAWRELEQLQEEISQQEMEAGWTEQGEPVAGAVTNSGLRTTISRVTLGVVEPDDDRLVELSERYGPQRICFEILGTPTEEDAAPAPWEPADPDAVSPETTTIDILVNERGCAGGQSAEDRLVEPDITYEDDSVTITPRIIPPPGDATCPGNPDTPATIELDEPLGDRELLDGSHEPPRTPDLTDER